MTVPLFALLTAGLPSAADTLPAVPARTWEVPAQPLSWTADGRYVAVTADPLVAEDGNGVHDVYLLGPGGPVLVSGDDVFVHDLASGVTERVSVSDAGPQAVGGSAYPSISADGRNVAFMSRRPTSFPTI